MLGNFAGAARWPGHQHLKAAIVKIGCDKRHWHHAPARFMEYCNCWFFPAAAQPVFQLNIHAGRIVGIGIGVNAHNFNARLPLCERLPHNVDRQPAVVLSLGEKNQLPQITSVTRTHQALARSRRKQQQIA